MVRSGFLTSMCLVVLLASGCAATGKKAASHEPAPAPQTEEADVAQVEDLHIGEFLIGPGDKIEVKVYRHDDLERSMTVDLSGKIMYPLVGDLQAAGKSASALRDELAQRLSRYLVKPMVTVEVTQILSQRMMVLGKVQSPGYFVLDTDLTVLDALARAGGATNDANLAKVLLVRNSGGKRSETLLDLRQVLAGKDFSSNLSLQNGDILYVPSTRISNFSRVAGYLSTILSPIIGLESGIVLWPMVKNTFQGKTSESSISVGQ